MKGKTLSRFLQLCTTCLFKNKGNHGKENNEKQAILLINNNYNNNNNQLYLTRVCTVALCNKIVALCNNRPSHFVIKKAVALCNKREIDKREFNMLGSKLFVSFMDRARSWPENVAFASLAL